eukprot:4453224-Alexandrium_andersonii.AAC.1
MAARPRDSRAPVGPRVPTCCVHLCARGIARAVGPSGPYVLAAFGPCRPRSHHCRSNSARWLGLGPVRLQPCGCN